MNKHTPRRAPFLKPGIAKLRELCLAYETSAPEAMLPSERKWRRVDRRLRRTANKERLLKDMTLKRKPHLALLPKDEDYSELSREVYALAGKSGYRVLKRAGRDGYIVCDQNYEAVLAGADYSLTGKEAIDFFLHVEHDELHTDTPGYDG
jgi:hypothetical protein